MLLSLNKCFHFVYLLYLFSFFLFIIFFLMFLLFVSFKFSFLFLVYLSCQRLSYLSFSYILCFSINFSFPLVFPSTLLLLYLCGKASTIAVNNASFAPDKIRFVMHYFYSLFIEYSRIFFPWYHIISRIDPRRMSHVVCCVFAIRQCICFF